VIPALALPAARGAGPPPVRPQASSFQWLIPGALGGMARPGLVFDEAADLAALRALGVRRLVSLEPAAFPADRLAAHGIAGAHLLIPDMAAPALPAACAMIAATEDWIRHGEPTVYHCKGGLGRTGTMLAAHLIARGMAPLHALEELRSIHPRYVQSIAQEQFLDQLAAWLRIAAAGERAR
jgi:polymorphic toxin system DSP-PTPase phosphatase-like protein